MAKKDKKSEGKDIRIEGTKIIWGLSAALMAMGIPLTVLSNGEPIVPVLTLIMATISTGAVWAFGHKVGKQQQENAQLEELNETIMALKNNVAMLEDTLGDELLRRRIESSNPTPQNETFQKQNAQQNGVDQRHQADGKQPGDQSNQ